jgi:hypothetical protein
VFDEGVVATESTNDDENPSFIVLSLAPVASGRGQSLCCAVMAVSTLSGRRRDEGDGKESENVLSRGPPFLARLDQFSRPAHDSIGRSRIPSLPPSPPSAFPSCPFSPSTTTFDDSFLLTADSDTSIHFRPCLPVFGPFVVILLAL